MGSEQVQSQARLFLPHHSSQAGVRRNLHPGDHLGRALDLVAERFSHYQGDSFATLVSPDATMKRPTSPSSHPRRDGQPHVDRHLSPAEAAVSRATVAGLGADVSNTNNMQELFSDVKAVSSSVPNIGKAAPVASYWLYHSQLYREARYVVISHDDYPLGWRSVLYLRPKPGTTAALLQGMAREILAQGLGQPPAESSPQLADLRASLARYDLDSVSETTGILPIRSSRRPPSMRPEALVKRLTAPIRRL